MAQSTLDEPSEDVVATSRKEHAERSNPFARVALFVVQVWRELRKVIVPTRGELFSYTGVVLVFVIVMMALVFGLDQLFGWLIILVFGGSAS